LRPAVVNWSGETAHLADATVLTIGVFDGVHIGHQALIGQAVAEAGREGVQAACLTFFPSPDVVLRGQEAQYLLLPEERAELMLRLGVDLVVVTEFSAEMAAMSAAEFMGRVVSSLRPLQVWVGEDFALGHHRMGGLSALSSLGHELGYCLRVMARRRLGGEVVSSSRIRRCLDQGDVSAAAELLGRPYSVTGSVVRGDGRGRILGYPTANVAYDLRKRLPADGVYAAWVVRAGQVSGAVVNVGVRPTFSLSDRTLEAYLFDFDGDLYGERVRVDFMARLRAEVRFDSPAELVGQLQHDVGHAKRLLAVSAHPEIAHGL